MVEIQKLDAKSRDDIPALLIGLQAIYLDEGTRTELFRLLDAHVLPGRRRNTDRPGIYQLDTLVLCIPPLGRLLPCDRRLRQIRPSASPRLKRRIPEVESATVPWNPWILGRVDDLRAAEAAKPNHKGIRNGLRVNSGKLIARGWTCGGYW